MDDPSNANGDTGRASPDDPFFSTMVVPILGVPVEFTPTHPALADTVDARFGAWRALERRPQLVDQRPGRRPRVELHPLHRPPGMATAESSGDPRPRPSDRTLRIRASTTGWLGIRQGKTIAGAASLKGLHARLRVVPEALHAPGLHEALDAVTLFLLTRLDREPVHAAAIAQGHRGLVLAGPSGAGKSTLAYAAHAAGLRVLTDDAVYVQLRPRLRVWGLARPLHLPRATAARFTELDRIDPVRRPGGKRKVPVPISEPDRPFGHPPVLERVGLCVLDPSGDGQDVERLAPDEAVRWLTRRLDPGFDAFHRTIPARIRALAEGGAWRVRTGERPELMLPLVRDLLSRMDV